MKRPARFLSLLVAVMMLVSSAVPAYAFEGLGEISNVTDYGEDVPSITEEDEDTPHWMRESNRRKNPLLPPNPSPMLRSPRW